MIDLGLLVLRLGLGIMFIAHGLQKTFGFFGGPGVKGFSEFLGSLGFNPPMLWAGLAAYGELLGGLCVIIGLGTRVSSMVLFIIINVAMLSVHAKNGFFSMGGGFEYPFLIATICLALILAGGGKFSITNKF